MADFRQLNFGETLARAQERPLRNRLLELQNKQMQQEVNAFPAIQQLKRDQLNLQNRQEKRLAASADVEAKGDELELFQQQSTMASQALVNLKKFPLEQRPSVWQRMLPRLQQAKIPIDDFDDNSFTDMALDEQIASLKSFKNNSREGMTASEKEFFTLEGLREEADAGIRSPEEVSEFRNQSGFSKLDPESQAILDVNKKQGQTMVAEKEKRVSKVIEELSERNRRASRSQGMIREALIASSDSTQGIPGAVKVQLARLFPGINVENEALLQQKLKELTIQELQSFTGPTTDFEFRQVENIGGTLSDGRSANEARLKALDRAAWFNRKEIEQFKQYIAEGKDPDTWDSRKFNFEETLPIGDKEITLRDLRDTAAFHHLSIEETLERLRQ